MACLAVVLSIQSVRWSEWWRAESGRFVGGVEMKLGMLRFLVRSNGSREPLVLAMRRKVSWNSKAWDSQTMVRFERSPMVDWSEARCLSVSFSGWFWSAQEIDW